MNIDLTLILATNYRDSQWTLNGNTYEGLTWLSDDPMPTEEELAAAWPQVDYQNQYDAVEQARLLAYEQTSDPLYFKWQRGDGTQEEWLAAVAKVKADNPYPPAP